MCVVQYCELMVELVCIVRYWVLMCVVQYNVPYCELVVGLTCVVRCDVRYRQMYVLDGVVDDFVFLNFCVLRLLSVLLWLPGLQN